MTASAGLLPVFLLILVGYGLRRYQFPGDSFWDPAERFLYYFLFPLMLIDKLMHADPQGVSLLKLVPPVVVGLAIATCLLWLLNRIFRWSGPMFTSVYQGGIRFNSYIGLAAVQVLYGDGAVAIAALAMAIMIPLLNILCILCFSFYANASAVNAKAVLKAIASNPLIIGSVLGVVFNGLNVSLTQPIEAAIALIGEMALPFGLLCVGAALKLTGLRADSSPILISSAFKLLVFPLVFVASAAIFIDDQQTLLVFLILGALPTATSSYILSRQLGGASGTMAQIISIQTLLGMATIPLAQWLFDFMSIG